MAALAVWSSRYTGPEPTGESCTTQKAWDKVAIDAGTRLLFDSFSDEYNTARILACQAPHSGDWLHAIPISACGLRLDDEAIRVAIGLRLGIDLCIWWMQEGHMGCHAAEASGGSHAITSSTILSSEHSPRPISRHRRNPMVLSVRTVGGRTVRH